MTYNSVTVINESGNTGADYSPSGDIIAGIIYQGVKLIDGTEGSVDPVGVSTNPLYVQGTITSTEVVGIKNSSDVRINPATEETLSSLEGKDFATQTTLAALNAKLVSGTDIGDVTINNGSGAGAVNIQDGGNSITVDGGVSATQSGTWNINNISGTISLPTGAATESTLSSLSGKITTCDTDDVTITSMPSTSNSFSSVTHSAVAVATSSTSVLSSNGSRKYALLINDSDTVIYLFLGATAAINQGIRLNPNGGSYEIAAGNLYTGQIAARHAGSGNKNLLVTEG